jgi:hypothetical protein
MVRRGWKAAIATALFAAGCTRPSPQASLPAPPPQLLPPRVAPAPRPPKPAPRRGTSPEIKLVGLSRGEVRNLLGEPAEQTDTGPALTWTYRTRRCSVALTFYFDVSRNDFFALGRSVAGTDGTEAAAQRCLKQMEDRRGIG